MRAVVSAVTAHGDLARAWMIDICNGASGIPWKAVSPPFEMSFPISVEKDSTPVSCAKQSDAPSQVRVSEQGGKLRGRVKYCKIMWYLENFHQIIVGAATTASRGAQRLRLHLRCCEWFHGGA